MCLLILPHSKVGKLMATKFRQLPLADSFKKRELPFKRIFNMRIVGWKTRNHLTIKTNVFAF